MIDHIAIAILAKDKAHTLPLYLECIARQTWPKNRTHLYVRTNNNNDDTAGILKSWLERNGSAYAGVHFDDSDVDTKVQNYGQHEWNGERFRVLAKIRQDSMTWATQHRSHYFVADCDNFIRPDTLSVLAETGLPIVAPLLHSATAYSNYHSAIDTNGYFVEGQFYHDLLQQRLRGLIDVPVVHCTYFVRHDVMPKLRYDDASGRYEYVIFSDSARKAGIPQYLDTRASYGRITFAESEKQLAAEPWLDEFASYDSVSSLRARVVRPPPAAVETKPLPTLIATANRTGRICLSMIVKNEAPVIERCLRSAKPFIDAWAIADTGSTDGTQDIIRHFLSDLPGELIERPWVDFSTNRNEALALSQKYGDFALVIDADEIFESDVDFAWPPLSAPGYMIELLYAELRYRRIALVRLDADWTWKGVLHEALTSTQVAAAQALNGIRIRVFSDGARSRQTQVEKFSKDAEVLRLALEKEPDNTRYAFYLAQSLRDAGRAAESIAAYERRIAMGGWPEEVYFSKLQIAKLKEFVAAPYDAVAMAYLDAHDFRPVRAEAPCEAARFFRLHQRWQLARLFSKIACEMPVCDDVLFVDRTVHEWRARDEWSIAAYWCGDFASSARLCRELLADPMLPDGEHERIEKNLAFAVSKT